MRAESAEDAGSCGTRRSDGEPPPPPRSTIWLQRRVLASGVVKRRSTSSSSPPGRWQMAQLACKYDRVLCSCVPDAAVVGTGYAAIVLGGISNMPRLLQ